MNLAPLLNPEIARHLLAGWVTGALVGLIDTALLVIAVGRSPRWPQQLSALRVSLPALTIAAVNGMLIGWTLIGLLLGAVSISVPMPRFSILVCLVALGAAGLYAFVRGLGNRGEMLVVMGCGLVATVAFAGMLPALAAWE
ncbi:MAG: hypothetical protein WC273_02285 [Dehalococcoidia bacterium]